MEEPPARAAPMAGKIPPRANCIRPGSRLLPSRAAVHEALRVINHPAHLLARHLIAAEFHLVRELEVKPQAVPMRRAQRRAGLGVLEEFTRGLVNDREVEPRPD